MPKTSKNSREMTQEECHQFLALQHLGRLAFAHRDRIDIQPIHYVNDGAWIFARTSPGHKITTLLHNPWCAFEVDRVSGPTDWASVVVKGTFSILENGPDSPHSRACVQQLLQDYLPTAFTIQDHAPDREIIFGIHINEITGLTALDK